MIFKLYSVKNKKRDFFNPPFLIEDENSLNDVILHALVDADVPSDDLKNFSVHYLGEFDNSKGLIFDNGFPYKPLQCVDLYGSYIDLLNDKYAVKSIGGDENA